MSDELNTLADVAESLAVLHRSVEKVDKGLLIVPHTTRTEDIQKYLGAPRRIEKGITFSDVGSFVEYYNRFKNGATPIIAAKRDGARFVMQCTFDYHASSEQPKWGGHTASLELKFEDDFARWMSLNNARTFPQEDFADFIEDYTQLFVNPDGATMLELVQELHGVRKVEWLKGHRLQNGQQSLEWQETLEAKGKKGAIIVPSAFIVKMPIFAHLDPVEMTVNLRWRMSDDRKLTFSYKIMNLKPLVDNAISSIVDKIEAATQLSVLNLA